MPDAPPTVPTPAAAAPPIDPMIAMMLEASNRVLGPDGKITNKSTPAPLEAPPARVHHLKVGEFVDQQPVAPAARAPAPQAVTPPSAPPSTPVTPPAAAPPAVPAVKVKPPAVQPPSPPAPVPAYAPPQAIAPPVPTTPHIDPDADFIANLDPDRLDEYQIAKFAESTSPTLKGKGKETLDYFRKVDAYIAAHPDTNEESDEFQEFVSSHSPKYSPRERRNVERQMVMSEAAARAKSEMDGQLKAQEREIHALKVKPQIEATLSQFNKLLSTDIAVPEGIDPIAKEVAAAIATNGYADAVKQYSVEAPIIAKHQNTAAEYLAISHNTTQFDSTNPTHKWLSDFVHRQGAILAAQPAANKTRNGRTFLPLYEFAELSRKNPAASENHWTFSDKDILDCLAMNAVCQVNGEIKKLEASGFKREKKSPKTEIVASTQVVTQDPPQNTRNTPTPAPGPAQPIPANSPHAAMLDSLWPGSSKLIRV